LTTFTKLLFRKTMKKKEKPEQNFDELRKKREEEEKNV
jgi:hypothetical protein